MELIFLVMILVPFVAQAIKGVELQTTLGWVIFGTNQGQILKCYYSFPYACEVFHKGDSMVRSIVVHGEYVFASHDSRKIVRCSWYKKNSCGIFSLAESRVLRLAVVDGHLYVGDISGVLKRCELNLPNSCKKLRTFPNNPIMSINSYNNYIYISLQDQIYYCTKKNFSCLNVRVSEKLNIHQVAITSNTLVVIPHRTKKDYEYNVMFYDLTSPKSMVYRRNVTMPGVYEQSFRVEAFKRKIYVLFPTGDIVVCEEGNKKIRLFMRNEAEGVITFSFAYGAYHMLDQFANEGNECAKSRPSIVFNYDIKQRAQLEVHVAGAGGLLHDARGAIVDTRRADRGHSGRVAVFAMGPDGQLLLSHAHRSGLMHISSLFAGGPVSGAGEIVVEDGVVKRIIACSQYYGPNIELNKQVVDELYRRGYHRADDIQLEECPYTCDQN